MPEVSSTRTGTLPQRPGLAGVVTAIVVLERTLLVARTSAILTVAPAVKLRPVIISGAPPRFDAEWGLMALTCGCAAPGSSASLETDSAADSASYQVSVATSPEAVRAWIETLPPDTRVATGIVERVRPSTEAGALTADLISEGEPIGVVTYTVSRDDAETRIVVSVSETVGIYEDVGRRDSIARRIAEFVQHELRTGAMYQSP